MIMLETSRLIKVFGGQRGAFSVRALNGISFALEKGEFVAIMGPSGSGKTTLLNTIGGIEKPTSGFIRIADKRIDTMNQEELAHFRRRQLGFVFQEFNLLDSLTLKENVMLPMILDKKPPAEIHCKVEEIMDRFGIYEICDKYPCHVSGGEQQRVAVSRALANDPSIVLADEPTGNLDSKSSKTIMECFQRMNEEMQKTILVVTHDVFAASYCNRVVFIKDGVIHSELVKKGDRKRFLERIMDSLAVLGGDSVDLS